MTLTNPVSIERMHFLRSDAFQKLSLVDKLDVLSIAEINASVVAVPFLDLDILGAGDPFRWDKKLKGEVHEALASKEPALVAQTKVLHELALSALLPPGVYVAPDGMSSDRRAVPRQRVEKFHFEKTSDKWAPLFAYLSQKQVKRLWRDVDSADFNQSTYDAVIRIQQGKKIDLHDAKVADGILAYFYPLSFDAFSQNNPIFSTFRFKHWDNRYLKAARTMSGRILELIDEDGRKLGSEKQNLIGRPEEDWPLESKYEAFLKSRPRDIAGITIAYLNERVGVNDPVGKAVRTILDSDAIRNAYEVIRDPREPEKVSKFGVEKIVLASNGPLPSPTVKGLAKAPADCIEIQLTSLGSYVNRDLGLEESYSSLHESAEPGPLARGLYIFTRRSSRLTPEGIRQQFRGKHEAYRMRLERNFSLL